MADKKDKKLQAKTINSLSYSNKKDEDKRVITAINQLIVETNRSGHNVVGTLLTGIQPHLPKVLDFCRNELGIKI